MMHSLKFYLSFFNKTIELLVLFCANMDIYTESRYKKDPMKLKLISFFILSMICQSSFALKRKTPSSNPLPRFSLQMVDNRTQSEALIVYNNQIMRITRGINGVFLPIDFTPPALNNPQLERSLDITITSDRFYHQNIVDMVIFSINKVTAPTADPNVQSIALRGLLSHLDNQNNNPHIHLLKMQDYFHHLDRHDQDNYFVTIILDGLDFSNSSFRLERQVKRARD